MSFSGGCALAVMGSSMALISACATSPPAAGWGSSTDADTSDGGGDGERDRDAGGSSLDSALGDAPSDATVSLAPDGSTQLPFVVDPTFVASGFMGDGETPGNITMLPAKATDSSDCHGNRATSTAVGTCHEVTYAPPPSGGKGWGGVYWQYPIDNWGIHPGYAMPPGATKVTFWAKGALGGEQVTFLAGGIASAGSPYQDTVKSQVSPTLTPDWASYAIAVTGQSYTQVLGAFGWTMTATPATGGAHFFIDGIRWE